MPRQRKYIKLNSFSLIELMVVIAIIASLSTIAVVSYKNYRIKARGAQATEILGKIIEDWIIATETGTPLPTNLRAYNQGTKIGPAFWGVQQFNDPVNGYQLSAENTDYVDPSFANSFINMYFRQQKGGWEVYLCTVGYFNGNSEDADLIHQIFSKWSCV